MIHRHLWKMIVSLIHIPIDSNPFLVWVIVHQGQEKYLNIQHGNFQIISTHSFILYYGYTTYLSKHLSSKVKIV